MQALKFTMNKSTLRTIKVLRLKEYAYSYVSTEDLAENYEIRS